MLPTVAHERDDGAGRLQDVLGESRVFKERRRAAGARNALTIAKAVAVFIKKLALFSAEWTPAFEGGTRAYGDFTTAR
jgi:hypothetical protein